MAVSVIEYGGYGSGRPYAAGFPEVPPIQLTQFAAAATSTGWLNLDTKLVEIFSTTSAWVLFTATTSSTIVLSTATSTNAIPIAANVGQVFYVTPNLHAYPFGGSTATSTSGFRYSIVAL